MIDHAFIERHSVIERYLLGQLPRQEEETFEEHLLGCSSCLRQLDEAEDFQGSLRAAVAEEVAQTAVRAGLLGWLRRREQLVRGLLLGVVLLAVPSGFLWRQSQQLSEQLNRPQANPLLVTLSATRGAGADFEDFTEIRLRHGQPVVLAVELALIEHDTYHFSLRDRAGELVFEPVALSPDPDSGRLAVSFRFLEPGDYLAEIAAPSGDGAESRALATFPFRIVSETPRDF